MNNPPKKQAQTGGERGRMISMVFIRPVWQQGHCPKRLLSLWRHTSCQDSLVVGRVVSSFERTGYFPWYAGSLVALPRDFKTKALSPKMICYLGKASSVVLHRSFAALTKGKRSFEGLISRCKTWNGSVCPGGNGFATRAETSAFFLCVHTFKF